MASIARRTLMNLLFSAVDCIRCFLFRGIETNAFIPLGLYTKQRYSVFPTKDIIDKHETNLNCMRTKTAKMFLNITQTMQEMQQTATVAFITASLTTPLSSIVLTTQCPSKTNHMDSSIDENKISLEDISCSLIDLIRTPSYCYFTISNSNSFSNKKNTKSCGTFNLRECKMSTVVDIASNDNSCNDEDFANTFDLSNIMLSRQRTFSESSDDNFICFVDEDDDVDDCKASSGSSKNYGYYSNQYDTDTDCSSEESSDEEEDEDSVIPSKKKVRFDPNPKVHVMRAWNFAYRSARKGDWENVARDRVRFQNRIQRAAVYLDPILTPEHRQKMYEHRFDPDFGNCCIQEPKTLDKPFLN